MRGFIPSVALLLLLALTVVNCHSTYLSQSSTEYDEESGDYDAQLDDEARLIKSRRGPPAKRSLNAKEIQDIVNIHNRLRAGEGASNMEVLRWNAKLASLGQQWADRCNFAHGQPSFNAQQVGYQQLGQNLYASSDPKHRAVDGVQSWFDEKPDYYYGSGQCNPGKVCGHYTQVVWAKTREVGCGWTFCNSIAGMRSAHFLVCNYGPAGNYNNQKPFTRGAPCTACDSGQFFCTNSLCDSSCSSAGSSSCKCAAKCGNCGTQTADCKCRCKNGWTGVACNEQCRDKNNYWRQPRLASQLV